MIPASDRLGLDSNQQQQMIVVDHAACQRNIQVSGPAGQQQQQQIVMVQRSDSNIQQGGVYSIKVTYL